MIAAGAGLALGFLLLHYRNALVQVIAKFTMGQEAFVKFYQFSDLPRYTETRDVVLIIVFSVLLIPVGLSHIGGFQGLHARVPAHMFELFGSASLSEYAWYTVVAMVLANLVSIVAVVSGMQTAGSATNEFAARIGVAKRDAIVEIQVHQQRRSHQRQRDVPARRSEQAL